MDGLELVRIVFKVDDLYRNLLACFYIFPVCLESQKRKNRRRDEGGGERVDVDVDVDIESDRERRAKMKRKKDEKNDTKRTLYTQNRRHHSLLDRRGDISKRRKGERNG